MNTCMIMETGNKLMALRLFRLGTDILLILGAPSHAYCLRIEKQLRLQMKEYIMLHVL